jgi:hypothetical protein
MFEMKGVHSYHYPGISRLRSLELGSLSFDTEIFIYLFFLVYLNPA